jgi:hypothetical protein
MTSLNVNYVKDRGRQVVRSGQDPVRKVWFQLIPDLAAQGNARKDRDLCLLRWGRPGRHQIPKAFRPVSNKASKGLRFW